MIATVLIAMYVGVHTRTERSLVWKVMSQYAPELAFANPTVLPLATCLNSIGLRIIVELEMGNLRKFYASYLRRVASK